MQVPALHRSSPVPLYFQVARRLEQLIESGELPVGGRLENEVELAERLGVSRSTVRRAIQDLVERGVLVRTRGIGTQIVHPKVRRPVELSSLHDDLVKAGKRPTTQVRHQIVVERSEEHTSELQSRENLVCRLL